MTRESIIEYFRSKVTKPLSFHEIVYLMHLTPPERRQLKRFLRDLVSDGKIVRTRKGLYGPPEEMSLVTGYFDAHREGYGFVVTGKAGERDLFIPARSVSGAMNNDRVVARIEDRRRGEGRIIRVLERAASRIVGTVDHGRSGWFVVPKGASANFDVAVSPKDRAGAKQGDRVVAEIIEFPTDKRIPTGRIVKVLGAPASLRDEIEAIIEEFHLPRRFPHDALDKAKGLDAAAPAGRAGRRRDLRRLPTVTIDGERARDFDDAVSIARRKGGYRLWVHVADVGHYVGWNTPIDAEARKRGTSVYFPDRVIPMLPKQLSEDLCSLVPQEDRPAVTVEMDFDGEGEQIASKVYPSLIRSDERMTYTSVRKILIDRDTAERRKYEHLLGGFETMGELCSILKERRLRRGSLDFDLPEPDILLDIQGNPEAVMSAERNFAHMIIEEFMIAANETVATYLTNRDIPLLYRIHEPPDADKLMAVQGALGTLNISRNRRQVRAADIPSLLKEIRGLPGEDVFNHMILRCLKQARYAPANAGHFGLASACYTHFTSPIRRYPDLVVHRILKEFMRGGKTGDARKQELASALPDIAFHSSMMERRADAAERAVVDVTKAWFMKDRVGEDFGASVISVNPYGLRVRLRDFFVEAFLHLSSMTDDFYRYDEKTMSLRGTHRKRVFTIGGELRVRIDRVDIEERTVLAGLCPEGGRHGSVSRAAR